MEKVEGGESMLKVGEGNVIDFTKIKTLMIYVELKGVEEIN